MIVFNFDVLARPSREFGSRMPDPDGILLWRAMHEVTIGRLSVLVNAASNKDLLEHWLKVNNIKAASYDVLDSEDPALIADKVHLFMSAAGGRHLYFDTNPETVANMMRMGVPSMLVCQPFVIRPEWDTPRVRRGWEALTLEIDRQNIARADKTWGEIE